MPLRAALIVAILASGACDARSEQGDSSGRPRRIVTLTPTSTELVCALGARDRLVGVDRFSTYPPGVDALPKVGDFMSPRIEAILGLAPDLVVLDEVQRKTADKLAAAGIATVVVDAQTIADVRAGFVRIADALGDPAAGRRAAAQLDAALDRQRRRGAAHPARPRVLAVVDRELGGLRGLVAAGPGSYLDELVALAGGVNVLAGADRPYVKLAADRVVVAAPDVILDATHGAAMSDWAEIARVPAVAAGRVHAVSDGRFVAPSPRAAEAAAEIEAVVHPAGSR